jgi:hypothetical protein
VLDSVNPNKESKPATGHSHTQNGLNKTTDTTPT